ncbi:hypothetical protein V6N13_040537 [Hibiscus sabdariffa]
MALFGSPSTTKPTSRVDLAFRSRSGACKYLRNLRFFIKFSQSNRKVDLLTRKRKIFLNKAHMIRKYFNPFDREIFPQQLFVLHEKNGPPPVNKIIESEIIPCKDWDAMNSQPSNSIFRSETMVPT